MCERIILPFTDQYQREEHWAARLMLEKSLAVNCPSVRYQLAGTKKVQQVLAQPGVTEKFASSAADAARLRRSFVGQFTLSDRTAVDDALVNPHNYVMKPQREGGGNNFYDDEVREQVGRVAHTAEADAYILMERIRTPPQANVLCKSGGNSYVGPTISEFGYYGSVLGIGDDLLHMKSAEQCLVRTKPAGVGEGGITAGYSCLSTALTTH